MLKYSTTIEAIEDFLNTAAELLQEQMGSLLETLEILEDKEFAVPLSASIEQQRNEETVNWSDALTQLNW